MFHSLKGRSVIVTGASKGLGKAMALALAAEGAQIHYLLGSTGFQAGLVPPEPGTYFKNQAYFYDGEMGVNLRGGQIVVNASDSEFIDLLYFTRVTDIKVAGGNLAFTAIALGVFGYVKGKVVGARAGRSAMQTVLIGGLAAAAAFVLAKALA